MTSTITNPNHTNGSSNNHKKNNNNYNNGRVTATTFSPNNNLLNNNGRSNHYNNNNFNTFSNHYSPTNYNSLNHTNFGTTTNKNHSALNHSSTSSNDSSNSNSNNNHNENNTTNNTNNTALNNNNTFLTELNNLPQLKKNNQHHPLFQIDTALENKKNEMRQVQLLLEEKRKIYELNEKKWKEKEIQLNKKKIELFENMKEMKNFNLVNENKIEKYQKKALEEFNQNENKIQQIIQLQQEIIYLCKLKYKKEKELQKINLYQNYLSNVAKIENNTFEDDIDKILKRYEILIYSIKELNKEIENKKNLIKQVNNDYKNFQKQLQNQLFELNATLTLKRSLLDKIKGKIQHVEIHHLKQETKYIHYTQLYSKVCMSIRNLQERCEDTRKYKSGGNLIGGNPNTNLMNASMNTTNNLLNKSNTTIDKKEPMIDLLQNIKIRLSDVEYIVQILNK